MSFVEMIFNVLAPGQSAGIAVGICLQIFIIVIIIMAFALMRQQRKIRALRAAQSQPAEPAAVS